MDAADKPLDSTRGKLLVSSVRLGDPNFARTVVLMLAHDENGALGVVLNRPLNVPLGRLSEEVLGAGTPREGLLFRGGPCESAVTVVFDDVAGSSGSELAPGVRFSGDRDIIESLLQGHEGETRFFAGYSGWSKGQLESELAEEAWLVLPATHEHVFGNHERLWELAKTELVFGGPIKSALMPEDPSMN